MTSSAAPVSQVSNHTDCRKKSVSLAWGPGWKDREATSERLSTTNSAKMARYFRSFCSQLCRPWAASLASYAVFSARAIALRLKWHLKRKQRTKRRRSFSVIDAKARPTSATLCATIKTDSEFPRTTPVSRPEWRPMPLWLLIPRGSRCKMATRDKPQTICSYRELKDMTKSTMMMVNRSICQTRRTSTILYLLSYANEANLMMKFCPNRVRHAEIAVAT